MSMRASALMQGHAQRRRTGTPTASILAAQGPPAPPDPNTIIAAHYHMRGGWMTAKEAQAPISQVDVAHGSGAGKKAHQALIDAGVIRKSRARSTTYHWNG